MSITRRRAARTGRVRKRTRLLAPRLRAHHFFALISLSTEMSRSRSASSLFSRAFSASSALQPLDIVRRELTEVLAPGVDGLLADLVLLGRLGDLRAVGLAQDGDHLLFGESTLPHGLLAVEEPSSQELLAEETGQVTASNAIASWLTCCLTFEFTCVRRLAQPAVARQVERRVRPHYTKRPRALSAQAWPCSDQLPLLAGGGNPVRQQPRLLRSRRRHGDAH